MKWAPGQIEQWGSVEQIIAIKAKLWVFTRELLRAFLAWIIHLHARDPGFENMQVCRISNKLKDYDWLLISIIPKTVCWSCNDSLLCTYIDGLMQERCDSIANTLELHLSCTNPSICEILLSSSLYISSYVSWEHNMVHVLKFQYDTQGSF